MALPFVYREAEPARQAIAQLQLEAAIAENASRERIAKEQTQQQRYLTQAQINEREKDRAVSREDIASRERSRTGTGVDAASRERGNIQYQTILGEISDADPMTKRELEARIAASPQISEDLANNLRSARDAAYKNAKANAAMGQRLANNYRSELGAKGLLDADRAKIFERLAKDPNVIFDRATGNVESVFRAPREDAPIAPPTASAISPAQDYGGASAGAVPTIGEMRARITGAPVGAPVVAPADTSGLGTAVPVPSAPPVVASDLPTSFGTGSPIPSMSEIGRWLGRNVNVGPAGITFPNLSMGTFDPYRKARERFVRASEFAPPPTAVPPPAFAAPREFNLPQFASPAGDIDALIGIANDPRFPTLPQEHQQWILDEIGNASQRMPRAADIQRIRPEFIPMDPYRAPQ